MSVLYALPLFPTVTWSPFRDLNAADGCSLRALVAFAANRGNSGPPKAVWNWRTYTLSRMARGVFLSQWSKFSLPLPSLHFPSAAVSFIFERYLSFYHLGLSVSRTRLRLCPDSTGVVEVLSTNTINNCETLLWCHFALFSNICCIGPVKRRRIHILYNMLSDDIFSRFGKHERLMQNLMWCLCGQVVQI